MKNDDSTTSLIFVFFIIAMVTSFSAGKSSMKDNVEEAYIYGMRYMYNQFDDIKDFEMEDYLSTVWCYFNVENDATYEEAGEAFDHIYQFYNDYLDIQEP